MRIETIVSGQLSNNTYIIIDEDTHKCAIIDPALHSNGIIEFFRENPQLEVEYIIATHGHFDHVTQIAVIKEMFGGQVIIHKDDEELLKSPNNLYYVRQTNAKNKILHADILVSGGEVLELGSLQLQIIHTPGHSKGSICIRCGDYLFSGDTLFKDDVGRTDLYGGSEVELRNSIKNVLGQIKENLIVLPGHYERTTLNYEKENNPYFKN